MKIHHRRSIRLPGYDYTSEGAYFVTMVAHHRERLFGEIVDGEMVLNDFGKIAAEEWLKSAQIRSEVELIEEEFVVMPNHFHGIVHIFNDDPNGTGDPPDDTVSAYGQPIVGAYGHTPQQKYINGRGDRPVAPTTIPVAPTGPKPKSLGALIGGYKSSVNARINAIRNTLGAPVWQRNYYEHIIGSDREYENVAAYIANNPLNWMTDQEREQ